MKILKTLLMILMLLGTGVILIAIFLGRIGIALGLAIIVLPVILITVQVLSLIRGSSEVVRFADVKAVDSGANPAERSAADYIIDMLDEKKKQIDALNVETNQKQAVNKASRSITDFIVAGNGGADGTIQGDQLGDALEKIVTERNDKLYCDVHLLDIFDLAHSYVDYGKLENLVIDYLVCDVEEQPLLVIMLHDSETNSDKERALGALINDTELDMIELESEETYSLTSLQDMINNRLA